MLTGIMERQPRWMNEYYKWKLAIFPDEKSRVQHNEPKVIEIISPETFTDFDKCFESGRKYHLDIPHSYQGPFMQHE